VPRTTSARPQLGPIELGGEWQVIGRLIVRRKGRLAINGRRKNRTRAERIATEEVVDELGLAIRVAGADARKPAIRVVETGGEQRCDDIARRCYVEVAAHDLAGGSTRTRAKYIDGLQDLLVAPLALARCFRRIPFQMGVQELEAFPVVIENQQLGNIWPESATPLPHPAVGTIHPVNLDEHCRRKRAPGKITDRSFAGVVEVTELTAAARALDLSISPFTPDPQLQRPRFFVNLVLVDPVTRPV
jgi:hypothetical protein